jgi:DNA-binding response OmpR family regulator
MEKLLPGKRILIVDDEPDVLDALEELLTMCTVAKAVSFQAAKDLLENERFDIVVLDIMGVDGYELLKIANRRNVIAVMLTAHALSPENIKKSFKGGAASYLPKEKISEIESFLEEVLQAKKEGRHFWSGWMEKWGDYYDKRFGPEWRRNDKEFWEKFKYWI